MRKKKRKNPNVSAQEEEKNSTTKTLQTLSPPLFSLSPSQVDEDYIQDDFNLSGLGAQVPYYDYALDLILDADAPGADRLTEEQHELVESAAEVLYGLIHARFVLTGKRERV